MNSAYRLEVGLKAKSFQRQARQVVKWLSKYARTVDQLPVLPSTQPGDVRALLPSSPPDEPEKFADVLADVDRAIVPNITHWQSPNFFAFFPSNRSNGSILADLLSSSLGVQGMLWITSPACTELETHMLDWAAEAIGLPERFRSSSAGGGVIQDSASSATLCAMLAARERVTNGSAKRLGTPSNLVAYCSSQSHSSFDKAAIICGLGLDRLRKVPVDDQFALDVSKLKEMIEADRSAGLIPFFVGANVGTTSSNAIDPVQAIGEICQQEEIWLHVDAAMSGSAAICPEFRWLNDGLEFADSYCFNPHKWWPVNFDCDCFYVADRRSLIGALQVSPTYLENQASASGSVIDYRDWQIPLGRRFRSLKLWFAFREFGISGLQKVIRRHVSLTQQLAQRIADDERFVITAPHPLNLVTFRHRNGDADTLAIMDKINRSGKAYLTHTKLHDQIALRICIGQWQTRSKHVARLWNEIQQAAKLVNA